MKRTSGKFDLTEWKFDFDTDKIDNLIKRGVAEAIKASFKNYPPDVFLLSNMRLEVALDAFGNDPPHWEIPLKRIIEKAITYVANPDGSIDDDAKPTLREMAKGLRELAERLEQAAA